MKVRQNGTTEEDHYQTPTTITLSTTTFDWESYERNQTIIEFYRSYDVMTGVRIAATLGGFFGLMVILVLYKSKSKTEKALEDPNFTAAAVAEVEEEDERQLAATILEQTNLYQQLNPRKSRRSLDISNMSTSTGWIKTATRFSSIGSGGYSNLMEPPVRTHRLPCFIDEDTPPDEDRSLYDDIYYNRHLDVPRRSSNITCSSSGSSYLERRDSSVAISIPALPGHKSSYNTKNRRRQSSPLLEIYDFYYPIDIKVIQPTPGGSPCGSDRALYDHIDQQPSPSLINRNNHHNNNNNNNNNTTNLHQRLAPLASISSCNSSLGTDNVDLDLTSYDSVFHDKNDLDHDTDDEIESFSTDSDLTNDCYNCKLTKNQSLLSTPINEQQSFKSSKSTITLIDDNHRYNVDNIASTSTINLDEKRAQETLF